jgi:hypothetical protein
LRVPVKRLTFSNHGLRLASSGIASLIADKPEWRNWQTRQLEGLVGFFLVQVQILSPAFLSSLFNHIANRSSPAGLFTIFYSPLSKLL